jgi:DNA-binding transcriptional ArsR family regulator
LSYTLIMEKGQNSKESSGITLRNTDDFVLDKDIFSNIFDKDIRRVYIYKKAERLAKALHMITPAFAGAPALKDRIDRIAVALVDAALEAPGAARVALSHELLTLSSMLSVARTGSLLSTMNADLIAREARLLLQEVALYEEPRLAFDESPTLAGIARASAARPQSIKAPARTASPKADKGHIGHISDKSSAAPAARGNASRREAVLAVVREKGQVYIKDISTRIRGVSEKTVQRELQALVKEGVLAKQGERRWTLYSLA